MTASKAQLFNLLLYIFVTQRTCTGAGGGAFLRGAGRAAGVAARGAGHLAETYGDDIVRVVSRLGDRTVAVAERSGSAGRAAGAGASAAGSAASSAGQSLNDLFQRLMAAQRSVPRAKLIGAGTGGGIAVGGIVGGGVYGGMTSAASEAIKDAVSDAVKGSNPRNAEKKKVKKTTTTTTTTTLSPADDYYDDSNVEFPTGEGRGKNNNLDYGMRGRGKRSAIHPQQLDRDYGFSTYDLEDPPTFFLDYTYGEKEDNVVQSTTEVEVQPPLTTSVQRPHQHPHPSSIDDEPQQPTSEVTRIVRVRRAAPMSMLKMGTRDFPFGVEDRLGVEQLNQLERWYLTIPRAMIRFCWPNSYGKVEDDIRYFLGYLTDEQWNFRRGLWSLNIPPDLDERHIKILLTEHLKVIHNLLFFLALLNKDIFSRLQSRSSNERRRKKKFQRLRRRKKKLQRLRRRTRQQQLRRRRLRRQRESSPRLGGVAEYRNPSAQVWTSQAERRNTNRRQRRSHRCRRHRP